MKNTAYKNSIFIITIAFALLAFHSASADTYWTRSVPFTTNPAPDRSMYNNQYTFGGSYAQYDSPALAEPSPQYYQSQPLPARSPYATSGTTRPAAPAPVATSATNGSALKSSNPFGDFFSTESKTGDAPVVSDTTETVDGNNLGALSLFGSDSFMPNTVFEWILVIVCILVIVILARILQKRMKRNIHTEAAHA